MDSAPKPAASKGAMENPMQRKRDMVLVVEDESMLRMYAAMTIEDAGFEVLEAANADEAVRILEARSDVRIVFTDIDMPGSMDGLKLAAAIRGRWPPIEIIVTSGYRSVAQNELPTRGVFLPKPYAPQSVVAVVRQLAA